MRTNPTMRPSSNAPTERSKSTAFFAARAKQALFRHPARVHRVVGERLEEGPVELFLGNPV